jgi:hypothetical protein
MRACLIAPAFLLSACGAPTGPDGDPDLEPLDRFGSVAVQVNGREWFEFEPQDSTVASYGPRGPALAIRMDSPWWQGYQPTLRLGLRATPAVGEYVATAENGLSLLWIASSPVRRTRRDARLLWFRSFAASSDSLILEEYHLNAGLIRGRFSFRVRTREGAAAHTIRGKFWGRLRLDI